MITAWWEFAPTNKDGNNVLLHEGKDGRIYEYTTPHYKAKLANGRYEGPFMIRYYQNGLLHRADGPATIFKLPINFRNCFYYKGNNLTARELYNTIKNQNHKNKLLAYILGKK